MIENKGRKKNETKIIDVEESENIIEEEQDQELLENETKTTNEKENIIKNSPKRLVALTPVLYLTHQYKIGDELPTNNLQMVSLWLEAGTAKWK